MLPPLSAIADQLMSIEVYTPTVILLVAFARLQSGSYSPPKGIQRMKRALKGADVPLHGADLSTVEG